MIIIQMSGGLGNQMFQYALGIQLEALGRKVTFDTRTMYRGTPGAAAEDGGRDRADAGNAAGVIQRMPMLERAFGIQVPSAARKTGFGSRIRIPPSPRRCGAGSSEGKASRNMTGTSGLTPHFLKRQGMPTMSDASSVPPIFSGRKKRPAPCGKHSGSALTYWKEKRRGILQEPAKRSGVQRRREKRPLRCIFVLAIT